MVELPKSRLVWRIIRRGSPEVALRLEDIPLPQLKKDEVLVRVHAAALNPVDHKLMKLLPNLVVARPSIVGADFAGVVADANGTNFQVGEAVFGWNPMAFLSPSDGAVAEFVKVPGAQLVKTPNKLNPTEVAGIPLAGLTAYQALVHTAGIEAGQSIFINGGSSSVGRFAIQIAKAKGCRVSTSCSASKVEGIKALGADEVFDYTTAPIHRQLLEQKISPKFHAIFETIGIPEIDLFANSPAYLAPNGVFISTGPQGSFVQSVVTTLRCFLQPTWLGGTPRKFRIVPVHPDQADLEALRGLLAEGQLKCPVDSIFSFKDTLKAFERIQTGKTSGKVVISVP